MKASGWNQLLRWPQANRMWKCYLEHVCSWRRKCAPQSCLVRFPRLRFPTRTSNSPLMSGKSLPAPARHFFFFLVRVCTPALGFTGLSFFQMLANLFHLQHKQTLKYRLSQRVSKAAFVCNKTLAWNGSSADFCAAVLGQHFFMQRKGGGGARYGRYDWDKG